MTICTIGAVSLYRDSHSAPQAPLPPPPGHQRPHVPPPSNTNLDYVHDGRRLAVGGEAGQEPAHDELLCLADGVLVPLTVDARVEINGCMGWRAEGVGEKGDGGGLGQRVVR